MKDFTIEQLIIGDIFKNIECVSFVNEAKNNSINVRPIAGQGLPTNINIECKKELRNVEGTLHLAKELKVCQKTKNGKINGPKYLLSEKQMLYPIGTLF